MKLSRLVLGGFAAAGLGLAAVSNAAVVYVDASLLNTDNAAGGLDSTWVDGNDGSTGGTVADGTATNDGLWRFRSGFGNNGVFEATGASAAAEDAVEIVTSVNGLADGQYNAYVFYFGNWGVRAGLTSNPNQNQYFDDSTAEALGIVDASTLTYAPGGAPPTGGETRTLYAGLVGQATVVGGDLALFIDDFPASLTGSSSDRSWYAGIGYEAAPIPEPGSLAVIGLGALGLMARRRRA